MLKIALNLLPQELSKVAKERKSTALVLRLTILFLVMIAIVTALAFGTGIYFFSKQQSLSENLAQSENQVAALKTQEGSLFLLKQRLNSILQVQSQPSKQTQNFDLITQLIPPGIKLFSMTTDKRGNIGVEGEVPSTQSLNILISALTNPDNNQDKIAKVSVSDLSRSEGGQIRFNLSIEFK